MGKVKKNWANLDNTASKNEEENEVTSESEDDLTQSEEEDSSNMELSDTSGDDDVIVVSNLLHIIY